MVPAENQRDHVFISYATEDSALADWLARRLAASGYAVWYDRMKLLGGEPWPQDIDHAIKTRTFRMLALLSRSSINKDNPSRERTTAQAVGRELKVNDFLVTLNVDGLKATEIPWLLSEINYIPFSRSWADGLLGVLKKLEAISAPRVLADGAALAIKSYDSEGVIRDVPEEVVSNCVAVERLPEVVHRFSASADVLFDDVASFRKEWVCRRVSPKQLLAFEKPPASIAERFDIKPAGGACWRCMPTVDGISSRDLIVSLIHASINHIFAVRGLEYSTRQRNWHVPQGLLEGNWLRYGKPDGSAGRKLAVGERTYVSGSNREVYRYHMSPSLSVLRGTTDPFVLVLRNRVFLTDADGKPLEGRSIPSRRKHLCKNWWNDNWLARALGVLHYLAGGETQITIGREPDSQVVISSLPYKFMVDVSIDETRANLTDTDYLIGPDANSLDDGVDDTDTGVSE